MNLKLNVKLTIVAITYQVFQPLPINFMRNIILVKCLKFKLNPQLTSNLPCLSNCLRVFNLLDIEHSTVFSINANVGEYLSDDLHNLD